ncbi:GH25 family lysozyme [Corynebacterium heidelbergense]|uniref:Peptidase C39-like domain-containing protein n=1 Tax=Corynebacterium heidelbergense TaxID=2055947 RepID=A0A364VCH2_9CORY|nr:GH25 family lysozyme [Corynebacterium heidelbergense]RAV34266.1 hypothetical protein CWC39_04235 [Corynebacterium heidelbergense]WCZ36961.1 Glycosyl hydrolases family 25 [Corynebacterium heidelbergense]
MTIFGADVSHYQSPISFRRMVDEGLQFVIFSTGDGDYRDPAFVSNVQDALDNRGLVAAAYHFVRAESEGTSFAQQADAVRDQYAAANCWWLPLFLDCETGATLTPDGIAAFSRELTARGITVRGIYTSKSWWGGYGWRPEFGTVLWQAAYPYAAGTQHTATGHPQDAYNSVGGDGASWWEWRPGPPTALWQFTDAADCAGKRTDMSAFRGTHDDLQALLYPPTPTAPQPGPKIEAKSAPAPRARERVLDYSRDQVTQDTGYWCGPASTQTIVWAATDNLIAESDLAGRLGTTTDGTSSVDAFPRVLNSLVPGADYRSVWMPNDPPTGDQKERLWRDLTNSIDAGFGVIGNVVAPPSNYPRAVPPSDVNPRYGGGTVYHYIALMGYSEDGPRRVWVADSGFYPYGYWIGFDQLATLLPPKGYVAAFAPPHPPQPPHEEDDMFSDEDRRDLRLVGDQLFGYERDERGPKFTGWKPEDLRQSAQAKTAAGQGLTLVEAVQLLRDEVAQLRSELKGTKK